MLCFFIKTPGITLGLYGVDLVQATHVIPFYLIGMSLALFDPETPFGKEPSLTSSAEVNVTTFKAFFNLPLALILTFFVFALNPDYLVSRLLCFFLLPYLIFSLGFSESKLLIDLGNRAEISYGLFLCSFPVSQILLDIVFRLSSNPPVWLLTLLCLLICIPLAFIVRRFIEKPSLKLSRKLLNVHKKLSSK